MARALRVDKMTLAALVATLRLYRDPDRVAEAIPTLRMLSESAEEVRARAEAILHVIGADRASQGRVEVVACTTEVGGGAMPLARVPSFALALRPARGKIEESGPVAAHRSRSRDRAESSRVGSCLDLRTVHRDELDAAGRIDRARARGGT